MFMKACRRLLSLLLAAALLAGVMPLYALADSEPGAQYPIVLTMGADLNAEQRRYIYSYFGVTEGQVTTITITNADEHAALDGKYPSDVIGYRTLSCALIRVTSSGGVRVKTANMSVVDSNTIATALTTCQVYNAEVIAAAPYMVSGTGALTGVMMAYEAATGMALDAAARDLANDEIVVVSDVAREAGQDEATLIVNDIKIHIVRDQLSTDAEIKAAVDDVLDVTYQAMVTRAQQKGTKAPSELSQRRKTQLYDYGRKVANMKYDYRDMQKTLERVTYNAATAAGLKDPIIDTFETLGDDDGLPFDSILLSTNDKVVGEQNVNSTDTVSVGDHPAVEIQVYTENITLTEAGGIKADKFIATTNDIAFEDTNGKYALMDLNGNLLTESVYSGFSGKYGIISARNADTGAYGVLDSRGAELIPVKYDVAEIYSAHWAAGIKLTPSSGDEYDYYSGSARYLIDTVELYYIDEGKSRAVSTLKRSHCRQVHTKDSYINITDDSKTTRTYDSSFKVVATPAYASDFGDLDDNTALMNALQKKTGHYVSGVRGAYCRFSDRKTGLYGIMDRYGNVIVPASLDRVTYSSGDSGSTYEAGGYFASIKNGKFVFVTSGGKVTASCDNADLDSYGMSALARNDDGSYTLLSGDGTLTTLKGYSYVYPLDHSKGLLYRGNKNNKYDLIDWHGNVLLTGGSGYSLSANGNYLIAQLGYTGSTLYLVNDASPVAIADVHGWSDPNAKEVAAAADLTPYTGDPALTPVSTALSASFIPNTYLVAARGSGNLYAVSDLAGNLLTDYLYSDISYSKGWLRVTDANNKKGILDLDGNMLLDCGYDYLDFLNEQWVLAYLFNYEHPATKDDYEFSSYSSAGTNYYKFATVLVCHLEENGVTYAQLTRDQFGDARAEEGYINIKNRSSGKITTYDSSFTVKATVSYVSDFSDFSSSRMLIQQIRDKTGYSLSNTAFVDGYEVAYVSSKYGVIDGEGDVIVPLEYDRVDTVSTPKGSTPLIKGYFLVRSNDMLGYVTRDGVSCELKYPYKLSNGEYTYDEGLFMYFKDTDGTYTIVSADGVESKGWSYPYGYGMGLFFQARKDSVYCICDWHGNVLFEDVNRFDVSWDGKYVLVQQKYGEPVTVYAVDGAALPDGVTPKTAEPAPTPTPEPTPTPAPTPTPSPTSTPTLTPTPAPVPTPEAEESELSPTLSAAVELIKASVTLLEQDAAANSASVQVLLTNAQALLNEKADAAAYVQSVVDLLKAGSTDVTTLKLLLDLAVAACR